MTDRVLIPLILLLAAAPAAATVGAGANLFDRGHGRASIGAGYGRAFDNDYFVLNGGLGYDVAPNLELGLDAEAWLGSHPEFTNVSPGVRYIFPTQSALRPYVGMFYRRTFYQDFRDSDAYGGRFGLYAPVSEHAYAGAGGVVEENLDCSGRANHNCTQIYPEFTLNFGF